MRFLTEFKDRETAERFVALLIVEGVRNHVEPPTQSSELFQVWIKDEDQRETARQLLTEFQTNPSHSRYDEAVASASRIVKEQRAKQAETVKLQRHYRPTSTGLTRGIPPLTLALTIICVSLALITNFCNSSRDGSISQIAAQLKFVDLSDPSSIDPFANIKKGELWRIVTPIFLHGSPFHLIFNMLMLVQLGRIIEKIEGSWLMLAYIVAIAIFSNILQAITPSQISALPNLSFGGVNFVGISGVVFGLFGFLWVKSSVQPQLGIMISPLNIAILIGFLFIGFVAPNMKLANMCHFGGLIIGMTLGYFSTLLPPMTDYQKSRLG